ncbi:hypothetical protein Tsubulata_113111 [Turnera subulata]|uniref:Receptor-like serine/threonine-protein kinase n=1 Tax=Turnera subulata TaxID=218843 RepID=A0A9Q0FB33_9ROSI|nr:hypothetical protein Tsubulata_113111 [Turnera subulata]
MKIFLSITFLGYTLLSFARSSIGAINTLKPNQHLLDDGRTLVSPGETFVLGFFSFPDSLSRYVGIWLKDDPKRKVVWVANRDQPIFDSSGVLTITPTGSIVVTSQQGSEPSWSSNSSTTSGSPVLHLLDDGNLVVKDGNKEGYVWQSFDYPFDTMLPGMLLGLNNETEERRYLTSSNYKCEVDISGPPQLVVRQGSKISFRSGPWNGVRFSGQHRMREASSRFKLTLVSNSTSVFYSFPNNEENMMSRIVLNATGILQYLAWNKGKGEWDVRFSFPADECDEYKKCGPNGICNSHMSPICRCPTGFVPKVPREWEKREWGGGCVRKTPLNCSTKVKFQKFPLVKLPDKSKLLHDHTKMFSEGCKQGCLQNCSCTAYAQTDIGCLRWHGDLLDIRECRISILNPENEPEAEEENQDQLPLYDWLTIVSATDHFSYSNKIGEGGFGSVYKGTLPLGQEIAVKRLSKDSGQGIVEFKNEVIFISKLQHRNLVGLLGCCIHGEERLLVYEYMCNGSLDQHLFKQARGTSIDWQKRFNIIAGIARGLLYLHRDSRMRIIHRDLKASNILLDDEMTPKISDFGLARTFGSGQLEGITKRIMGTFGYMSPEYATDGVFSTKSDVFSFGVLVIEIVSGEKNRGFCFADHEQTLLGHAWKLWNEGRPLELMDASMEKPVPTSEILNCINIGLLCVQHKPEDRPTMANVVSMLDSEGLELSQPKQPGFFTVVDETDLAAWISRSTTEVTMTTLEAR